MTPENKAIKEANARIKKADAKRDEYRDLVTKYQNLISTLSSEIYDAKKDIEFYEDEKSYKRKCLALCKKYDYLHIDEIDGNTIWFSCSEFDEDNEKQDPFYDDHFVYSWAKLFVVFNVYLRHFEPYRGEV